MNLANRIGLMHLIQEANMNSQLKSGVAPDKLKAIIFKDKSGKRIPNSQLRGLAEMMGVTMRGMK